MQETLPGVLDYEEFTRVSTNLGRCDVCDEGKATEARETQRNGPDRLDLIPEERQNRS